MTVDRHPLLAILPDGIALRIWEGDDVPELLEGEAAAVERAVPTRQREFARGRWCAREALRALGGSPKEPILPGDRREPLWPDGFVGSITHTRGFIAAVVGRNRFRGIGFDAEVNRPLPGDVRSHVLTGVEQAARLEPVLELVTFCAKEAVYKAVYPSTGRWLDFTDVCIEFGQADGTFRVRRDEAAERTVDGLERLRGRFLVEPGHVFAFAEW